MGDECAGESVDDVDATLPAAAPAPAPGFTIRRVVRARPRDPASDRGDGPDARVVSRDETEVGWGDGPSERDDDWYRRERPPHHE